MVSREQNDKSLEEVLQETSKGPRITPDDVDAAIRQEQYHVFPETTTTVCCLTLKNGFTVVGKSACVFPANFNEEIGRKVAYEKAKDQVWDFLGYQLKEDLERGLFD